MQGWVSIHRKIMNNPVWQDPKLLKLWMLCLLEASHKEHEQLVGKQLVKLQPGQFVTGRFSLSKSYNEGAKKSDCVPDSTLWRWLKWLETNEFLNIKTSTKFSVVTVVNWNLYQQNDQQVSNQCPSNDQQVSNQCPSNDQQVSTNNKGNKANNIAVAANACAEEQTGGVPTTEIVQLADADQSKGQIPGSSNSDYHQIKDAYMRLAAIGGFDISPKDQDSIRKLMSYNIAVEKVLKWLEECFRDYKPKHQFDKINSFAYCLPIILDKHTAEQEGDHGKKVYQPRSSNGRSSSKSAEQALREAEEARKAWGG